MISSVIAGLLISILINIVLVVAVIVLHRLRKYLTQSFSCKMSNSIVNCVHCCVQDGVKSRALVMNGQIMMVMMMKLMVPDKRSHKVEVKFSTETNKYLCSLVAMPPYRTVRYS